ncbi:MAG: hypothetical protein V7731_08330 [Amphritea sp.]
MTRYIARVYADFSVLGPRFIELSNRFYGLLLLDYVTDSNSQEQADD